jgi:hypothetical protein
MRHGKARHAGSDQPLLEKRLTHQEFHYIVLPIGLRNTYRVPLRALYLFSAFFLFAEPLLHPLHCMQHEMSVVNVTDAVLKPPLHSICASMCGLEGTLIREEVNDVSRNK